jgi:hypothetical protein
VRPSFDKSNIPARAKTTRCLETTEKSISQHSDISDTEHGLEHFAIQLRIFNLVASDRALKKLAFRAESSLVLLFKASFGDFGIFTNCLHICTIMQV